MSARRSDETENEIKLFWIGKQAGCQRGQSEFGTARRSFGSVQVGSSCTRTEAGRRAYRKLVLFNFWGAIFFSERERSSGIEAVEMPNEWTPAQVGCYYNLFTSTAEILSSAPFTHALASKHLFVFSIDACGY